MDTLNRSATGLIGLFERYGLALVMLFVLDIFMPNLAPKVELVDQDLSAVTAQNAGSNILKQLFWLGMLAGYLMLHMIDRLRVLRQSFWVCLMLIGLAILAGCVSSSYVATSLKRVLFQFIFLFVVFSATHYAYRNRTLRICVWVAGMVVMALSLFTLAIGAGSNSLGLAGYTNTKNVLGAYIAILLLMTLVAEFVEGRKVPFSLLFKLALLVLLVLTKSKTSFAVLLMVMVMTRSNLLLSMVINLSLMTGLFTLFVFWPAISYELGGYWHLAQHVPSTFMTNRGEIWLACYDDLEHFGRLLSGWGYASYFGVKEIPYAFDMKWSFLQYINSSHNGYISILIQLGLFLAIPVYVAFAGMVLSVRNLALQATLLFPILHNTMESSFLRDQHAVWFSFIWICGVGFMIKNQTRQISILDGVQEYRQSQRIQWRNQPHRWYKKRSMPIPAQEPVHAPIPAPAPTPAEPPGTQPQAPNVPINTPVMPDDNKPEDNVIVAPWAAKNPVHNDIPNSHDENQESDIDNILSFARPTPNVIEEHEAALSEPVADALTNAPSDTPSTNHDTALHNHQSEATPSSPAQPAEQAQNQSTEPRHSIRATWAGVELTLVTSDITDDLDESALSALTLVTHPHTPTHPAHTHTANRTHQTAFQQQDALDQKELDQIANSMVTAHWHGENILFVTDHVAQRVQSEALVPFHRDQSV